MAKACYKRTLNGQEWPSAAVEVCPIRTVGARDQGSIGEPTEKCKPAFSSADGNQPFAEAPLCVAPRRRSGCRLVDTSGSKMDGVLAEDARTSKTLFGGSARVSEGGGYTPDPANYSKTLGSERSDEFCHTRRKGKAPKGGRRCPVPSRPWSGLPSLARAARGKGDTCKGGWRSVAAATRRQTKFQAVTFPWNPNASA